MFKDGQTIMRHETRLTPEEIRWCVNNDMSYHIEKEEEKWEDSGHSGANTTYYITFYNKYGDYKNRCNAPSKSTNIIYNIIEKIIILIIVIIIYNIF